MSFHLTEVLNQSLVALTGPDVAPADNMSVRPSSTLRESIDPLYAVKNDTIEGASFRRTHACFFLSSSGRPGQRHHINDGIKTTAPDT
ncbi:unnamed protein product [Nippostrongylus brasiliensis]|uniref:Transcriptional regulator n=1 Tax=Nippostrongylus brasiliensis TaxID=27835 RepID=A0A0N4YAK8_NIPBR|nr:unnamed protein product [Nippostrongylus brasiliensis]